MSRGFSRFLAERFKLADRPERPVRVLYDRPASTFTPIDRLEREQIRQALFVRLGHPEYLDARLSRLPDQLDRR